MSAFDLASLMGLTSGRFGRHDVACPICGPGRSAPYNRRRKVLRIWAEAPNFATYHCARCGLKGYAREGRAGAISAEQLAQLRADAVWRAAHYTRRRAQKALALWRLGRPARGTIVETYLASRGIACAPPATVRFLPALKPEWKPAMVAAFGMADGPEPALIGIAEANVRGVHLTLLKPDGSGKAGTGRDKFTIGRSLGAPIVLAPLNDILGLVACEGIEDGLSLAEGLGLGAWAAGSASRMPALTEAVPSYVDCVTVAAHPDPAGLRGASELAAALGTRGINVETLTPSTRTREAA